MRILQVIHQFPPYSSQGSEVYCHRLSKRLSDGDDVRVFHVSNAPGKRALVRETYDGLQTYHCIDRAEYSRLSDWPNRFLREQFQAVLSEWRPEVVHFHNYISLGDDLVSLARAHHAAVVYTLHDFGLICPNTFLLRTEGQLCGKNDPDFFQDCCPELIRVSRGRPSELAARVPSLARWTRFAREQRRPILGPALEAAVGAVRWWMGDPRHTDVALKRDFFMTHTRRIFEDAHLFLAPSEFLRQRYISCGVAPEKIAYARYGLRRFERLPHRRRSDRIAFGYIGALHAQKGIELLLDAFEGLQDRAELHIYGSAFGSPISASYWQRLYDQHRSSITFHGEYENARVPEILASLDVVVVPSIWYENSPLTIQEAFIAGVPVVTANQGGMAELVRDEIDGLHFRLGDAGSLREKLTRLIAHPELLETLRNNVPAIPDIDQQTNDIRIRYQALVS